jgi:ribosomal protein S27E
MELKGEQIQGSRFYRNYCKRCGEPMRVSYNRKDAGVYCETCSPKHISPSSAPTPLDNEDEYSSSWKIASGIDK